MNLTHNMTTMCKSNICHLYRIRNPITENGSNYAQNNRKENRNENDREARDECSDYVIEKAPIRSDYRRLANNGAN